MPLEAIVTLIGVALLVGALALYLSLVAYHLTKVNFTLGTVVIGVAAIENQTRVLDNVVGTIAGEVTAIDDAMRGLVEYATSRSPDGPDEYSGDEPATSVRQGGAPEQSTPRRIRARVSR